MKSLLFSTAITLLAFLPSLQSANAAENEEGTLTLKGDQIVFKTLSKSVIYSPFKIGSKIEDAKIVKFEPKSIEKNGKEINISEITLENTADGTKLTLIESVPSDVFHSFNGQKWIWKPKSK
jgi:hypothetical protein